MEVSTRQRPEVIQLDYPRRGRLRGRPGLLSLLAIASLLFGATTTVAYIAASISMTFLAITEPPRELPAGLSPLAARKLTPYSGDPIGLDGFDTLRRSQLLRAVNARLPLSRDGRQMLDRLLADIGRRIFPADDSDPQTDDQAILGAGTLATPNIAQYFTTRQGQVKITRTTAVFVPADRSGYVLLERNVLLDGIAPRRWCALAIGEALDSEQRRLNSALTPLQAAALYRDLLHDPPPRPDTWQWPTLDITIFQGGTILCRFPNRRSGSWVLIDGREADMRQAPNGIDPRTGVPYGAQQRASFRLWPGSRDSLALLGVIFLLEGLLAQYLAGGAVLLLRKPELGGRRHARFVLLKLWLLLLGVIALTWWATTAPHEVKLQWHTQQWWLPLDAASLLKFLGISLLYPAGICAIVATTPVRNYLHRNGCANVWADAARTYDLLKSPRRDRLHRFGSIAMLALALVQAGAAAVCWTADGPTSQTELHFLGAFVSLMGAGLLCGWRWRNRALPGILVWILLMISARAVRAQASIAPFTERSWSLEADARGSDPLAAEAAIRALLRAGDSGQASVIALFEQPPQAFNRRHLLDIIVDETRRQPIEWTAENRPEWMLVLDTVGGAIADGADDRWMVLLRPQDGSTTPTEICPALTQIVGSPHLRSQQARDQAAEALLRATSHDLSDSITRLIERGSLAHADQRQAIMLGLLALRPAADQQLLECIRGENGQAAAFAAAVLTMRYQGSESNAVTDTAWDLFERDQQSPRARIAAEILCDTHAGRARLIDAAFGQSSMARSAQAALLLHWPISSAAIARAIVAPQRTAETAEFLRRLNDAPDDAAVRTTLLELLESNDHELRVQAALTLAHNRKFEELVGLDTFTLATFERGLDPAPSQSLSPEERTGLWRRSAAPNRAALLRGEAIAVPIWASALIWLATVITASAIALLAGCSRNSDPLNMCRRGQRTN